MKQRRVAITGLGIISPYGGDLPDFFARLLAGESAVHFLHTDDIPRPLAIPFVSCHGFNPDEALGRPLAGMMDRFAQLGTAAAFNAAITGALPGAPHWAARWHMKKAIGNSGKRAANAFRRSPSSSA